MSGTTFGGDGGNGATKTVARTEGQPADSKGCIPQARVARGGRGGGVGRIRINASPSGLTIDASSPVSPAPSLGTTKLSL